ncbi:MAG: PSD1 domain-containing protein [Candidatus Saccharimonas sp.]|nr:PSD1 domain-containing protein [Planctomycetaceae bacterium]
MLVSTVVALAGGLSSRAEAAEPAAAPNQPITFEQHVRPILKVFCLDCHGGGEKLEGKLDLRLKRFIATGGESGAALLAGKPGDSLIIKRLKSGEMPPTEKKVPAEQIAIIEQWIASGAATSREEPETLAPGLGITAEERAYWFYQPIRRPVTPAVKQPTRMRSAVDAFVLAKLGEKGLDINDEADRFTLLKRATFDLIGLPPTPEETEQFLADAAPDAYERLLDRLLASPHYGERWGRHWLDVAGYADSEGDGSVDTIRPYIYKFRDYVIRSLNADKPLDQFLIEQLAGDELVTPPYANMTPEQIELLAATGFLRMAADPTASGQGDPDTSRNQVVADTIKIVSSSLLGLSVGCAQCHDHRYDPIPQADYFQLRAIFQPALDPQGWVIPRDRVISLYTDEDRAKSAAIEADAAKLQADVNTKRQKFIDEAFDKEIEKHPAELRDALRTAFKTAGDKRTDEEKKLVANTPSLNITGGNLYQYNMGAADELKKDDAVVAAKRAEKKVEDFISVLKEPGGDPRPTHLFHRGDHRSPKEVVKPADLTIAASDGQRFQIEEKAATLPSSGRRLAWAKHITNGSHPLVGRVLANRIWLHHFGRGIVDTPGEFGLLGTRPTHPELLDWLACELLGSAERGAGSAEQKTAAADISATPHSEFRAPRSLKRQHRQLMSSAVYRQSSRRAASANSMDMDGSLYSRFPVRRLEAEIVRDRSLAIAGRLNNTLFGQPVEVMEDFAGQVHVKDDSPRRSLYIQARRTKPVSLLAAFDAPVMTLNCDRRPSSTVAPQSLMLMNGDFLLAQADHLAKRVRAEAPTESDRSLTEPLALRYASHAASWQYGHGFAEANGQQVQFNPLPHFTGSAWQGGAVLPDPTTGYSILHAAGGHAGNDQQHATIRRWTAPREGIVTITGQLKHPSENGDGVRGRIISSRSGLAGQWDAKTNEVATSGLKIAVQPGDTLDFLTDCRENVTSDSFEWRVRLELADSAGKVVETWDSAAEFHGPLGTSLPQQVAIAWRLAYGRPATSEELELGSRFVKEQTQLLGSLGQKDDLELMALTNLCQQLLSSNEFLYVD